MYAQTLIEQVQGTAALFIVYWGIISWCLIDVKYKSWERQLLVGFYCIFIFSCMVFFATTMIRIWL